MMRHLRYASYVIRHKWYVMLACWRYGLYWQGIVHDWHKFLPSEWFPYVSQFGGGIQTGRDKTGYYKPTETGNLPFEIAWLFHQKRAKHHWQSWVVPIEGGAVKAYEIPRRYVLEMFADWEGAGRAQGKPDIYAWWVVNAPKMTLHPQTQVDIEVEFHRRLIKESKGVDHHA